MCETQQCPSHAHNQWDVHVLWVNSSSPGRCGCILNYLILNLTLRIDIFWISCEIAPRWMTSESTLVDQVMASRSQATKHYLSQCWPRFMSPYGITRPQWVKSLSFHINAQESCKVQCCYNVVNFSQNHHNTRHISCLCGRDMGRFLWV